MKDSLRRDSQQPGLACLEDYWGAELFTTVHSRRIRVKSYKLKEYILGGYKERNFTENCQATWTACAVSLLGGFKT